MSRKYDEAFLDLPAGLPFEDRVADCGIIYQKIPGHYYYYVTNYGDVISFMQREPRLLKTWSNKVGHLYVGISNENGTTEKYLVHRLVAEAFIPNPNNYPVVRHLNDIPWDNRIENLAWGTQKDNVADMYRNGNAYVKAVYCFENGKTYDSCADAARDTGVFKSQITTCCQGKTGTANGLHFCYLDEKEEKMNDPLWLRIRNGYKSIIAISKDGNQIRFNSRKEAAETLGIPDCGISSVVNGKLKHTHGWTFVEG